MEVLLKYNEEDNAYILDFSSLPKDYQEELVTDFKTESEKMSARALQIKLKNNSTKFVNFKEGLVETFSNFIKLEVIGNDFYRPEVELSRHHFISFRGFLKVYFHNISMLNVKEDLFYELKNMTEFALFNITNLSKIDIDKFLENSNNLRYLIINDCGNLKLPEKSLRNENLFYLSLEGNNLTQLPVIFFQSLRKVQFIILRRNQINEISQETFSKCLELISLDLSENFIEIIKKETFKSNIKLEFLLLHSNKLKIIEEKFDSLNKLGYLHLDNNLCINNYYHGYNLIKNESENILKMCKRL